MNLLILLVSNVLLNWTSIDGTTTTETVTLSPSNDINVEVLHISREDILSKNAKRLDIIPEFSRAKKGERGYWFSSYGYYGEYDCTDGVFFDGVERVSMPMFGWSNPRGSFLAIITSLQYFIRQTVTASNGEYTIAATLEEVLCQDPYDDLTIEYHKRPSNTTYSELARIYRNYQLDRGAVKPFKERFLENKILEKAVMAPEIRIRQAWKPVPSPIIHQAPENEPEVKAVISFDRVKDIVSELKKQGVNDAELCLVGWNIGGHDGRWPQFFPAEPKLGGDKKLKEAIDYAINSGYLIVPHGNFHEGYTVADNFDGEMTIKYPDGRMMPTRDGKVTWGGGRPYFICPQRAYEKICSTVIPRLAAFGFKGIGYFDVVSILEPQPCKDPRHPCTQADGAKYWGLCASLSKRDLGGFASESGIDSFAGNLDYSLYTYFGDPREVTNESELRTKGMAKTVLPIWEIVYHGIISYNPFTITMNPTIKDRYSQLKAIEFGGRPSFYFYANFKSDGDTWMGNEDLICQTDEQLSWAVSKIKEGYDCYERLKHLQLEYLESHDEVAPGVFCSLYSNGEKIYVNYNDKPIIVHKVRIPAQDFVLVK